jgi:hypothetical protein
MSSIVVPAIRTGRRLVAVIAAAMVLAVLLAVAATQLAGTHTTSSPSTQSRVAPATASEFCLRGRLC